MTFAIGAEDDKAKCVTNFRPIALCNVCVKSVNKMIANRIKLILSELITANKTSFMPARQSMDNVIICQELIHSLRYTKGRKGGMIMKLDLEKTYDRIEWGSVEETLRDSELPAKLVSMIISLMQWSSCRLIWNREATDNIIPTRGLLQGDPLSPYIYILCVERLSQWIN